MSDSDEIDEVPAIATNEPGRRHQRERLEDGYNELDVSFVDCDDVSGDSGSQQRIVPRECVIIAGFVVGNFYLVMYDMCLNSHHRKMYIHVRT